MLFLRSHFNWESNSTPTLRCSRSNDLFTVNGSSRGNRDLDYPVGLVTIDEAVLAGGSTHVINNNYYLYTGQNYWTISPYFVDSNGGASVFYVYGTGGLSNDYNLVHRLYGVRPVINLRADVQFTGIGTSTDPYQVVGA